MSGYNNMVSYVTSFKDYLANGVVLSRTNASRDQAFIPKNVLLVGMGGSGIGADIVCDLLGGSVTVPMGVLKYYDLPNYVNDSTLLIVSSYSGNTEESISALKQGIEKNCKIVCICSGGEMEQIARENGILLATMPAGIPPRASLPYSVTQTVQQLVNFGLVDATMGSRLDELVQFLSDVEDELLELSNRLAADLLGKLPIIYMDQKIAAVGVRWRQQLNENSKVLSWERAFPEMNHNELVGWKDGNENLAVIFLKTTDEHPKILKRFLVSEEVIKRCTSSIYTVTAKGNSFIQRYFYLILLGDWVSVMLAEKRSVDAVEVSSINFLKSQMNNL